MPDTSSIPQFHLKVVLLTHFLLLSISTLGSWTPTGYLIYNFGLLSCLLWSVIKPNSPDAAQFAFFLNLVSIILDIFTISLCFPYTRRTKDTFAVAFGILHLLIRPFTSIYLLQVVRQRTGNSGLMTNIFPAGRNAGSYEDIDRSPQAPAAPAASYDFSAAEQI